MNKQENCYFDFTVIQLIKRLIKCHDLWTLNEKILLKDKNGLRQQWGIKCFSRLVNRFGQTKRVPKSNKRWLKNFNYLIRYSMELFCTAIDIYFKYKPTCLYRSYCIINLTESKFFVIFWTSGRPKLTPRHSTGQCKKQQ